MLSWGLPYPPCAMLWEPSGRLERKSEEEENKLELPEAAVVAVSSEKLFLLEPEDDDLELAEFSHAKFVHSSEIALLAHQVHDHLVDLIDCIP